ncbi:hypothetical protein H2200_012578 [Cladophialophora chaetospira]|uniref:Glyoxalase/fosfomycin resistance/dioxygenase domain-containing protein n=1 Tax=Cladophialophora chaetospira TaxID=386627 RepID=A0AA38WX73_9EURO|nr:hypothetical protein H2200_012578 [Cladophialophora chaetospira]
MAEKGTATATTANRPPAITHILETCLMVKDVGAATEFYKALLSVEPFLASPRMSGFALSQTTLLLFQLGDTAADNQMPDGRGLIPGHGPSPDVLKLLRHGCDVDKSPASSNRMEIPGRLNQHFCLAVSAPEDVQSWEKWFEQKNVKILGKVNWPRGGKSVYFSDLDGNVGEIGSRGIWEHF